jgi:predicted dehydrogenase
MFLYLTGEETQVTGAQLSRRAHERPVEDYASVMLRSASGILGTIEVGNGFPRDGTDGEWKIAGRDAILTMKDGIMKLATAEGDETLPGANVTAPAFTAVRDALDHWRQGAAPPISVHDCARDRPSVRARGVTWHASGLFRQHRSATIKLENEATSPWD